MSVLRRQGLSDAVVDCDAALQNKVSVASSGGGTMAAHEGSEEEGGAGSGGGKGKGKGKKKKSSGKSSKGSSNGDGSGVGTGGNSSIEEGEQYIPIDATITSIRQQLADLLARLLTKQELDHVIGSVGVIAAEMEASVA